ncbi:MAG: hypothetical protein Q4G69_00560 [Planctomycetia bacterium]|nr:hypothetical protein [Planctomycetia bacterium]
MKNADESFVSVLRTLIKNYKKSRALSADLRFFNYLDSDSFDYSPNEDNLPVYSSQDSFYLTDIFPDSEDDFDDSDEDFSDSEEDSEDSNPLFPDVGSEILEALHELLEERKARERTKDAGINDLIEEIKNLDLSAMNKEKKGFKQNEKMDLSTVLDALRSCILFEKYHLLPDLVTGLFNELPKDDTLSGKLQSIEILQEVHWSLFQNGDAESRAEYAPLLQYSIFSVLFLVDDSELPRNLLKQIVDWGKWFIKEFGETPLSLVFMVKILRYQSSFFRKDNLRNFALTSLEAAIAYCRELIRSENENISLLTERTGEGRLAILYWDCAQTYSEIGDKKQACQFYGEVLNLWKALDSGTCDDAEKIYNVQMILAQKDKSAGKNVDALKRVDDALEYALRAYKEKTPDNFRKIAVAYDFKITLMEEEYVPDEIGILLDRIHNLFSQYYEPEPDSAKADIGKSFFYNWYYSVRAAVSAMKSELEEAERYYLKAIQAIAQLSFFLLPDFVVGDCFLKLHLPLNLLINEGKDREAIEIMKLALHFLDERIINEENPVPYICASTTLKINCPDLVLKLEEANHSPHFLSMELDALKNVIDEGGFKYQELYANLLKIRGADYARYGLTADEAISDLLKARYYMEFAILDECSYDLANSYFDTTLQIANLFQKQGKPEEARQILLSSRPMITALLERNRFECLSEFIFVFERMINAEKECSSPLKALRLCDELLAELSKNQKVYSPEESLRNRVKDNAFLESLQRVSAFDLRMQTPVFPEDWEDVQNELKNQTSWPPEDLLKAKQYICEFFQQNIVFLEIRRFHIKPVKTRIKSAAAWMEKIIPEYIARTLAKSKEYDRALPHFLYDYREMKIAVGNASKISKNYVLWFNQLAKYVEEGESSTYRPDLLVLLEACVKQCSILEVAPFQEMEKMFNVLLVYTLSGYRLNKNQAGFEFARLSNIKASWGSVYFNTRTHFKTVKATLEILYDLKNKGYEKAAGLLAKNFLILGSDISLISLSKALKYYKKSCRYYRGLFKKNQSLENISGLGKSYCSGARVLEKMGKYRKAAQLYRKGIYFLDRGEKYGNKDLFHVKIFYLARLAQILIDHCKYNRMKKTCSILKFTYWEIEKSSSEMFMEDQGPYFFAWIIIINFLMKNYLSNPLKSVFAQTARFVDVCPLDKISFRFLFDYFWIKRAKAYYRDQCDEWDKAREMIGELRSDLEKCEPQMRKKDFLKTNFELNCQQILFYRHNQEYDKGIQLYEENRKSFEEYLEEEERFYEFFTETRAAWVFFFLNAVSCFIAKKKIEQAKEICLSFLNAEEKFLNGKMPFLFVRIAAAYMEILCLNEEYESVIQWAEKCIKLYRDYESRIDAEDQNVYYTIFRWRAAAWRKRNETEKALADLDYLIRNKSKMMSRTGDSTIAEVARYYCMKGEVLKETGRIPEARMCLEKARCLLDPVLENGPLELRELMDKIVLLLK